MKACCPSCKTEPLPFQTWRCFCGESFNHFETGGKCPSCGYNHEYTECMSYSCQKISLHVDWYPVINQNISLLRKSLSLVTV